MKLQKLITNVQQWSINRGLDKADSKKQILKLYEEFGELASGLAKGNKEVVKDSIGDVVVVLIILAQQRGVKSISDFCVIFDHLSINDLMPRASELIGLISLRIRKTNDEIEEYIVRLISCLKTVAESENLKFEDCLSQAWNEIKDRKGKLIDDVWVKEEDLKWKF
nr:MAG TPA: NTP-PPase-like protein [Caudoviricetes sp.]